MFESLTNLQQRLKRGGSEEGRSFDQTVVLIHSSPCPVILLSKHQLPSSGHQFLVSEHLLPCPDICSVAKTLHCLPDICSVVRTSGTLVRTSAPFFGHLGRSSGHLLRRPDIWDARPDICKALPDICKALPDICSLVRTSASSLPDICTF